MSIMEQPIVDLYEGNKIIALFMDWKETEKSRDLGGDPTFIHENEDGVTWLGQFKYHCSWNELMPACQKWDNLYEEIEPKNAHKYVELSDKLDDTVILYEIVPLWLQLVENIRWYNEQKS
jgi:hypothetical protein